MDFQELAPSGVDTIANGTVWSHEATRVPVGATYHSVEPRKDVRHITFILVPDFTLLAFSSALDPLRIANQLAQKPLYRWSILSEHPGPVPSSSGISVTVGQPLASLPRKSLALICAGTVRPGPTGKKTQSVLHRHARHGGEFGGICTGARLLAQAGLLRGRRITLHWENQPAFKEEFPDLNVTSNIFEIDDGVYTCGGGSASTDMMLGLIERDYGPAFSTLVSDMCLHGGRRRRTAPQRSSISYITGVRNQMLTSVVTHMMDNIETPLELEELEALAGGSRRQIERLFKKYLKTSPARFYRNLRLDHGRTLLVETDMTVIEIAMACGFSSSGTFSRAYRDRFGNSPFARPDPGSRPVACTVQSTRMETALSA